MDTRTHLRNLLVMAMADGALEDAELTFLTQRCQQMDLDEQHWRDAVRYAMDEQAAVRLPVAEADQELLLRDLIQMMTADQVMDEQEKRLLALVAAKLGFSPQRLSGLWSEPNRKPS